MLLDLEHSIFNQREAQRSDSLEGLEMAAFQDEVAHPILAVSHELGPGLGVHFQHMLCCLHRV